MKKLIIILCMLPAAALGQQLRYGPSVTIDKPVNEDIYIAGGNITINAPVHGDLVLAGGTVTINDTVTSDILVAGGEVTFNGYAGDDIRCAGGRLVVLKNVAGDLVVTGGNVQIASTSVVAGSLVAGGGNVLLDGTVKGYVRSGAGSLKMNGIIEHNLDVKGGEVVVNGTVNGKSALAAQKISIGPNAAFMQDVRYWNSKGKVEFAQSVKNSRAFFDHSLKIDTPRWQFLGFASFLALLWYLAVALIFILLVRYLSGGLMQKAGATLAANIPRHLVFGLLFFILAPVGIAAAFVTIIGIPVALLALILYSIILLLSSVITAVVIANWINTKYEKRWNFRREVWASLVIFILLKLVSLIPFLGWMVMLLAVCMAFGAIIANIRWRPYRPHHKTFAVQEL